MNRIIITGNLTKNPEFKHFTEGDLKGNAVCKFTVAVKRLGSKRKDVDFIPVEAWGGLALSCGNFLKKGRKVAVCGQLRVEDYKIDGIKRYKTFISPDEVEFLSPKEKPNNGDSAEMNPTEN